MFVNMPHMTEMMCWFLIEKKNKGFGCEKVRRSRSFRIALPECRECHKADRLSWGPTPGWGWTKQPLIACWARVSSQLQDTGYCSEMPQDKAQVEHTHTHRRTIWIHFIQRCFHVFYVYLSLKYHHCQSLVIQYRAVDVCICSSFLLSNISHCSSPRLSYCVDFVGKTYLVVPLCQSHKAQSSPSPSQSSSSSTSLWTGHSGLCWPVLGSKPNIPSHTWTEKTNPKLPVSK